MARKPSPHVDVPGKKLTPEDAFGRVVRERRLELRLTQADLEEEGELERSYISKLEAGKHPVSLRGILFLAKKLRLSPQELIGRVVDRLDR